MSSQGSAFFIDSRG
jgi:predicted outer membrane repeat protein